MTPAPSSSARRAARLLALLGDGDGLVSRNAEGTLEVAAGRPLRRLKIDPALIDDLLAADLLAATDDPGAPGRRRLALTDAGRAHLRRADGGEAGFRRQHGAPALARLDEGAPAVLVDAAESPLAWLARRRDKDGRAYLSPARFAAGERLRADFTLARMMPTVTSNWSDGRIAAGSGGNGGVADLTDRAIAARARVRRALEAVGTDLADVLLDVCCFLKGLETVESDRRWPARSAKVVLDIALGRLADHYGLADEARGRGGPGRLRAWGSGDHRPVIGACGE